MTSRPFLPPILILLVGPASTQTLVDFEVGAPTSMQLAAAASTEFSALGVYFDGPFPGDGGAIVNQAALPLGVGHARSGTDVLSFERYNFHTTGFATDPVTITFRSRVSFASLWVAGASFPTATFQMFAYDGPTIVGSAAATGADYQQLAVSVPSGFTHLIVTEINYVDYFHMDDLEFAPIGNPTLGDVYCTPAVANSTGSPATIEASGSASTSANDLTLVAEGLPTSQFGLFLVSDARSFVAQPAGSQGNLCLGGNVGGYVGQVAVTSPSGTLMLGVDLTALPTQQSHSVVPGETWNFQCWFRDRNRAPTSNFTDAISITFQ